MESLGSVWTGLHLLSLFTEDVEEAGGQSSVFSEFTFSSGSCVAVCHSATVEVRGQPQGRLFLARYFT